jgi:hypothetical protein
MSLGRLRVPAAVLVGPMVMAVLAGCGAPSGLDAQQRLATARACASLIERRIGSSDRPVDVGGDVIDLQTDPDGFYSTLLRQRGPDDFPLDDPSQSDDIRAGAISSRCNPKDASRRSGG